MIKDDVKQMIDKLPENCSIEDIQYTLYVRSKIEKGLRDHDEEKFLTTEEVQARMQQWLKK